MNTTTATTDTVLAEIDFVWTPSTGADDLVDHWIVDAPNGLWTITHLDGNDYDVEGPNHHHPAVVLEGRDLADAYVRANGVDRRRTTTA